MSNGWKWSRREFRKIMKSHETENLLMSLVTQAQSTAQGNSGLQFGAGVDNDARREVSARGWVGASSVDSRTGRVNEGLHKKQVEALKSVGW